MKPQKWREWKAKSTADERSIRVCERQRDMRQNMVKWARPRKHQELTPEDLEAGSGSTHQDREAREGDMPFTGVLMGINCTTWCPRHPAQISGNQSNPDHSFLVGEIKSYGGSFFMNAGTSDYMSLCSGIWGTWGQKASPLTHLPKTFLPQLRALLCMCPLTWEPEEA